MSRHVFDKAGRISARELETIAVKRWIPPTIGEGGHLVYAEPREDTPRRSQSTSEAEQQAVAASAQEAVQQGRQEGFELGRQEGLAQGKADGFKQGYEQGVAEGRQEGLLKGQEEARGKLNVQLAELNSLLTNVTHVMNEQDYQLEKALLNLVQEVARAVVGRELALDSGHIMKTVRAALAVLPPSRDNVRIIVNPRDLTLLEQAIAQGGENWRSAASDEVEPGGCRIQTDQSLVDFTTGTRFRMAVEQILNRQVQAAPEARISPAKVEDFEPAPEPVVKPFAEPALLTEE